MKERRRVKEKLREQNRSRKRTGVDQKRPTTADESARRAGQRAAIKPVVIANASEAEPVVKAETVGDEQTDAEALLVAEECVHGRARSLGPEKYCLKAALFNQQKSRFRSWK